MRDMDNATLNKIIFMDKTFMGKIFCVSIPLRIVSEANTHQHHMVRYNRQKKQVRVIKFSLCSCDIKPPCLVTITRVAPRSLDALDNLPSSLKHVIDAIASYLIPGLKPGRADGSKEISWHLSQEKGPPKTYALRIKIEQL